MPGQAPPYDDALAAKITRSNRHPEPPGPRRPPGRGFAPFRKGPAAGVLGWPPPAPQAGREQRPPRPAPSLSPRVYNAKARLAIACPITSQVKGYPFEVDLPATGTITGVVLADHVKNLDWEARRAVFEAKASSEVLTEVRERLRALLEL